MLGVNALAGLAYVGRDGVMTGVPPYPYELLEVLLDAIPEATAESGEGSS